MTTATCPLLKSELSYYFHISKSPNWGSVDPPLGYLSNFIFYSVRILVPNSKLKISSAVSIEPNVTLYFKIQNFLAYWTH